MLDGANLHGLDLAGAKLDDAELVGTNLSYANLSSAEIIEADFVDRNGTKRTDLTGANLAHADLEASNLSPRDSRLTGVKWLGTTCPNGVSSDEYTGGCFGKPVRNPLVVTVKGVKPNGEYVLSGFKINCHTTDALEPVTVAAKLKITRTGPNGIGKTTATCEGAIDAAGDRSAPVSVSYDVVYGFGGFKTPKAGTAISLSAHRFTATFALVDGSGTAIAAAAAASFAKAGDVEVTRTGPGIGERTAKCGWKASSRVFSCVVPIPSGAKAGHTYHLTALENPGLPRWDLIPGVNGSVNPQPVKFK
jgi:hypothetical protein